MMLVIIGGVGFVVWSDVYALIVRRKKLSVYSSFVLILTAILILFGALSVAVLEWDNPGTLGRLPLGEKIIASVFHSVSMRTAGFTTLNSSLLSDETMALSAFLMLIGGASGSTAGGIKISTFGIIIYTIFSVAVGRSEIIIFKRKISNDNILRAFSITGITMILTVICSILIAWVEKIGVITAVYEVVAAISTTGMSNSLTPSLSMFSHIILMMLMFFGRVRILTITYSIMLRITMRTSCITRPEAVMYIG